MFWLAIRQWILSRLLPEPARTPMDKIASLAVQLSEWAAEEGKRDWFAWEGEQYAKCPSAFWFDHWRYHDTKFAYPEPTEPQRRANWNASLRRMIEIHGEAKMKEIGNAVLAVVEGNPELEQQYWRAMAPWEWAIAQHANHKALH